MKIINEKEYIWAEKYRPQCIEDVILPDEIKKPFMDYVKDGRVPNMLFNSATPGLGKTSLVNALIKELKADVKWINGSMDGNIDTMRDQVVDFCSSVGFEDAPKIIVIDEADGISDKGQKALRGVIEEFSEHVSFIFTANYKEKLIEALRNRLTQFDFDEMYHKHKKEVATQAYHRLKFILENEGKTYDSKSLQTIITNYTPSIREMIMVVQRFSTGDALVLDDDVLATSVKHVAIMEALSNRQFPAVRKGIQALSDPGSIYTYLFNNLDNWFPQKHMPQIILTIAKYQEMHSGARDKIIPATAMCVEIMLSSAEFLKQK